MKTPRWFVLLLTLYAFVACFVTARAQSETVAHRILVDGSGSMRGFFVTSELSNLYALLREQAGQNSESYYFVDTDLKDFDRMEAAPRGRSEAGGRFGNRTYISNALTLVLNSKTVPSIVWLVTDNQPSAGNDTQSDKDLNDFYAGLQSERIRRIHFFPLRLQFKGPIYQSDGTTELKNVYEGPRGLMVYALLLDQNAQDAYERSVKAFEERFRTSFRDNDVRAIRIKPLEQDTVTAKLIPGDKFKVEKDRIVGGDFEEGKSIRGTFKLELTSNLGQVKIDKASINISADKFTTGDFAESELTPRITPKEVENFRSGAENRKEFTITLEFNRLNMRDNPTSWWRSINEKRGYLEGNIRVSIEVPPQNMSLVSESLKAFSTNKDVYLDYSPEVQKRIYRLDELVKKMTPQHTLNVQPKVGNNLDGRIPVRLGVKYPNYPLGWLFAALLVSVFFIVGVLLWKRQQPLYRLTWNNGTYRACPDFSVGMLARQTIEIDSSTAATIKSTLTGMKASAASGFTIDNAARKLLNPTGSDFSISRRNDVGVSVSFHFAKVSVGSGDVRRSDVFADNKYGADYEGDQASSVGSEIPVRKPTTGTKPGETQTGSSSSNDDFDLDSLL